MVEIFGLIKRTQTEHQLNSNYQKEIEPKMEVLLIDDNVEMTDLVVLLVGQHLKIPQQF